ncbi:hypothetical protein [Psychrobium sp. 1_MG-2023]|uniref:hypothetical protein n=1 Tax=Psychrobium sp. 1_MG-2023 TaxID=3062624 RepID=UPI000C33FC27|nr:hypothetical protein [Psychrobium sp. 1_MG-2023]MDP2562211.1 hypothetical protein [Psychrobium sp. 1_MG-2023]PKF58087.1 hypothetical protein CW748_04610 [Alteromonadales bacterium alter-6D02]
MDSFDLFVLARVLHIVAVVLWIGGVGLVTLVLIPSLRAMTAPSQRLALFEQLEGRFAKQAKWLTVITMLSGVYMIEFLNAWSRYSSFEFWWMHLMTFIWLIFSLVLFVFEPLFLHRWFHQQAEKDSEHAFMWLHRMHQVLLSLSLIAIAGAMAGSHGYSFH